jgi:hypothetical protein
MKTRYALTVLLAAAAIAGLRAADEKAAPRTEVVFSDPDKFTDASDGPRGTDIRRDANLAELRDYLVERAERYVPAGDKLTVTVTDVDLAGEVEPWHTRAQDVRIIRDIYAPKIDLTFRLTDASGAVVKEGKRHLTDPTFTMNINPNPSEPRVYERRLLDDWLRSEFRPAKK